MCVCACAEGWGCLLLFVFLCFSRGFEGLKKKKKLLLFLSHTLSNLINKGHF